MPTCGRLSPSFTSRFSPSPAANSLLPFFGVSVYTALGANDTAIFTVNVIESAARFGVLIMMILRYRMMKRRGDLFRPLCEE